MTSRCTSNMVRLLLSARGPIVLTAAGMNDVLPKPFTKEGLLNMLEKHLSHLKKQAPGLDPMGAPPAPMSRATRSLKTEDSPATSPATTNNWDSPNNMSGVSPASNHAETPNMYGMSSGATTYAPGMQPAPMYNMAPMGVPRQPQPPPQRRNINEISGGAPDYGGEAKRQQMYAPSHQPMGQPMQRPSGPPR